MTRTKALLALTATMITTAFVASPAAAYDSVNSITGTEPESPSYRSVNSVTGGESANSDSQAASAPSSANAILAEGGPSSSESPGSLNAVLAESPLASSDSPAGRSDGYRTVNAVVGDNEPPTSLVEVRESSGFDWGDALIGASATLVLMLMAFGAARLISQQRRSTAESQA
jgi:hypothetical protein